VTKSFKEIPRVGFYVGRKKPFAKSNGKAPSLAVDASDILRFGKISKLKQFHR